MKTIEIYHRSKDALLTYTRWIIIDDKFMYFSSCNRKDSPLEVNWSSCSIWDSEYFITDQDMDSDIVLECEMTEEDLVLMLL